MENYLVIARKWRPQTFEEMIGQEHVSRTLHNALRSGRLHHALLFTGPRGVGKTSSARILAKSLKCPKAENFVPCNTCSTCQEIISGSHMDVMEIDGASHNGVDAIRELRETVGYMPSQGKYKIYIVDEVHMLSVSAFNALLKTLEEPPSHVVFIFATTEPQKIPLTILSRVQRFDFRRIPTRLLADRLEEISTKEGISYDKDSLWLIARQADGSARDSQSLLDQIITFTDGRVTVEQTIEVLGLTNRQLILQALTGFVHQDTQTVLKVAADLYQSGADSKVFIQDLLETIRNALILRLEPDSELIDLPDSEIDALREIASHVSEEDLHLLFDMALKGATDILRAQDQRLTLEMVLLRMAQAPRVQNLMGLTPGDIKKKPRSQEPRVTTEPVTRKPAEKHPDKWTISPGVNLETLWSETVLAIKQRKPFWGAKLDHVALSAFDQNRATLIVSKDKKFIFDQLTENKPFKELSQMVSELWNQSIQLDIQMAEVVTATPIQNQIKKQNEEQIKISDEVEAHPLIKSVKSNLKVEIKSITNGRNS